MDPVIINTAPLFEQQPPTTWIDTFGWYVAIVTGIVSALAVLWLLAKMHQVMGDREEYEPLYFNIDLFWQGFNSVLGHHPAKAKNDDMPKNDHKRKNDELVWNDELLHVVDAPDARESEQQ